MNQGLNFDVKGLRTDEALGFLLQMAAETKLVTVEADQAVIKTFTDATTAFEIAMKPTAGNSYTEARAQADATTDHLCVGVRMYAEAQTYSPDANVAAIAKKTLATIDKYGQLVRMGYKEQYPNLLSLLNELKARPAADNEALGLNIWINALDDAYNNFVAITAEKIDEESQKQVGIVQDSRNAAQEAYTAMMKRLDAGAEYMGEAPYTPFFDKAKAIIAEYKSMLDARKTRSANKKENEENQE